MQGVRQADLALLLEMHCVDSLTGDDYGRLLPFFVLVTLQEPDCPFKHSSDDIKVCMLRSFTQLLQIPNTRSA